MLKSMDQLKFNHVVNLRSVKKGQEISNEKRAEKLFLGQYIWQARIPWKFKPQNHIIKNSYYIKYKYKKYHKIIESNLYQVMSNESFQVI